jgi:hypothetical protein
MLRGVLGAIQRWQYRGGRPRWSARIANRLGAITFAAGVGPNRTATLEVRGHKSGRTISLPVVVADYQGERYPSFPIDRRAPLGDFEHIVDQYPVFRVA